MGNYLSASELAELIGCKQNQKAAMKAWLESQHWKFQIDKTGLPKVARAYHDRMMGVNEEKTKARYAEAPNLEAFA